MRKIYHLLGVLSGLLLLFSCQEESQSVVLPRIAQKAIADSTFLYYDTFGNYTEDMASLPIGMFDSSVDGILVMEQFLTIDQFDNITGAPVPDGISDFGGENFQFLVDMANGPYVDYIEGGNVAFLKEHLMTNLFFLMGKSFYTLSVDDFKSGQKERVKAVVSLTNTADYTVGKDFSNFAAESGANILSVGLMSSAIKALFENISAKNEVCIGILSSGDDVTVREYESAIRKSAGELNYQGNLKIVGQRALGLGEAILSDYDYISMISTTVRSNYQGPDIMENRDYVDNLMLNKYNFNTSNNGLLCKREDGRFSDIQLNSVENYVRYHIVSMVEHHRRSGSKIPISYILLSDYKYSVVKDYIKKTLDDLYNYKQDGMYLYRTSITPDVKLIDPIQCAARDCYLGLRNSRNLALRTVRSELVTFVSVPVLSLSADDYTSNGMFTKNYRVSRAAGVYNVTSKVLPFSTRYIDQDKLNYIGTHYPVSYSLIKNSLY